MSQRNIFSLLLWFTLGTMPVAGQPIDSLVAAVIDSARALRVKQGQPTAAIQLLDQTLRDLVQQNSHPPFSLVPLYHKLGVNHYYQRDFAQAEPYASKALELRRAALGETNLDVARSFFLRGAIRRQLRLYDEAAQDIKQAIGSMESLLAQGLSQDTLRLMNMYDEFIDLCTFTGNHTRALPYWEKSYRYYRSDPERFAPNLADLAVAKGRIFDNQKQYADATDQLKIALKLYQDLYRQHKDYALLLAGAYSSLAYVEAKQNLYKAAIMRYAEALGLLQSLATQDDTPQIHQELGTVYNNLLKLYGNTKTYPQAVRCFTRSLHHLRRGWKNRSHPTIAELFRDRATIELERGHLDSALFFNTQSLQVFLPDFRATSLTTPVRISPALLADRINLMQTLSQRADLLMTSADQDQAPLRLIKAALSYYEAIDTVIIQISQRFQHDNSRYELIATSYPLYERAISAALNAYEQSGDQQYLATAFYFSNRNKALVLLGDLQGKEALTLVTLPPKVSVREKKLKSEILQLEAERSESVYDNERSTDQQTSRDILFDLQRSYQKLIDSLEASYPEYVATKYGLASTVSAVEIQQRLQAEEVLIEYFVGTSNLFLFYFTDQTFGYHRLALPHNFATVVDSVLSNIQRPAQTSGIFLRQAHQVYRWLLPGEITSQIPKTITDLIVVPDGELLHLPFDILVTGDQKPTYLLERFNLSYLYSSQLLRRKNKQNRAPRTFAGFGLEYDAYTLAALNEQALDDQAFLPGTRALGKLHYSDDEVQEIAEFLDGDQWLNAAATHANFIRHAGDYAILHLATHGILNQDYPLKSALAFTKTDDSTQFLLRAADLYSLPLRADLVVLSACNTGVGVMQRGEGTRSLARAFAAAGCPSTVASLWNASDKSTKDILTDFYRHLHSGCDKSEALNRAKLNYLTQAPPAYQAPFYWAHLAVVGDTSPVEILGPSKTRVLIFGVITLLVVVAIWLLKKKPTNHFG